MGFGALRVINDDRIAAGRGFGTHGHRDMEIITYVLDGAIAHKDSMGSGSTILPGNVQRMSAGRGVMHSEFNPLPDTETHMLQIWIEPEVAGIAPEYEERGFSDAQKRGRLQALVSADGIDGSMKIHQDARLYSGLFDGAESAALDLAAGRRAWVHVARGSVLVNGTELSAGDAAAITDESRVELSGGKNAEVLVFDLA
jgi:redox-sensitive bicupin YhaK (pirin superfamily)